MGYANSVRNAIDGKTYTVSTVQKFETWESAVFEGSNALLMGLGRGLRYLEYTFPWDAGAEGTHQELVLMARDEDPQHWRMSKEDTSRAREVATAFVTKQGEKFLSMTAENGWRVRKGSAQRPRGYSVPLFIPEADAGALKESDPLTRYARGLVDLSVESADAVVKAKGTATVGLVSEFCYFYIQWAQRTAAAKLTDSQMTVLVPELCYSVYDITILRAGLTFQSAEEAETFKAGWINTGADRNDVYSRCPISRAADQGLGGTLFWEASKVIATEAAGHDDPKEHITLGLLLPAWVTRLDVDLLVAAAARK
jgi:hypothetical protein